jgi:acyl carrier protein
MRCGAAYVPLDPELPTQRLQFMAERRRDQGADLRDRDAAPRSADLHARLLNLADIRMTTAPPFASVQHRCRRAGLRDLHLRLHRPAEGRRRAPSRRDQLPGRHARAHRHQGTSDVLLAIATYAFDASILELYLPLVYGARLVLADSANRSPTASNSAGARDRAQHRITRIFTAPAAWRLLLASGWSGQRGLVACSWAEPLTARAGARELLPLVDELWNLYGPTETTVWTLGARIVDADESDHASARRSPTPRAYVLDERRAPLPVGVTGELYIGGAGITLGYLNRAELQADKFIEHAEFGMLYRTGDLARWLESGEIVCLGRADHQIKLRGFRIELGEIEALLESHADITTAACGVVERSSDDPRLVAWIQRAPASAIDAAELRRHLRSALPGYMVPQHFVILDELPRLSNGKLDRRRLPSPFDGEATASRAPSSDSEQRIAALWRDVLAHDAFGADDRFLDVGGHSLLAVQMAARLQRELGVKLPLREVMTGSARANRGGLRYATRRRNHRERRRRATIR